MAKPSISLPDELLKNVDRIALARSKPGDTVPRSKIVREALQEYVKEHEDEVAEGMRHESAAEA